MTTTDRTAKLAYLTQPEPGVYLLNLQFDEPGMARGQALERVEITSQQLAGICADGVKALWAGEVQS
jgi:hypothetical protein